MAGGFGALVVGEGLVRFRFWAPDCEAVSVEIGGRAGVAMVRDGDGVFELVVPCDPDARYKFRVRPDLAVPDPASRAQAGDVHDASIVVDSRYGWKHGQWRGRPWREAVIYELHVGACGGFAGVEAQLPRLAALGVTAVELMPIADFPGRRNWGYDGVLPYAPDAAYGTPAELRHLVDAAHGLGLQIFLDVVYNHFGPDGNYLSSYASGFFDDGVHTPWGGAVNFKNPHVRRFFIENALYWISDYRFDGLRFDAVHAIMDDEFLLEMAAEIRSRTPDRHVHLILENENNEERLLRMPGRPGAYDAQWTDDWHHCLHVLLTGENEGYYEDFQNPASLLARCLAEGFAYQGEPSLHAGGAARGTPSAHLSATSFVICLQNHDQVGNRAMGERLAALADLNALRAAAILLLMTPQIPMIFMGEEYGERKPFLFFTDHHDELADAVRHGRRKEFARFAAFTHPQARQKIPDPNAVETFTASTPDFAVQATADGAALLALYQSCLQARAEHIAPKLDGVTSVGSGVLGAAGVFGAWRLGDGARLTVAANFAPEPVAFSTPEGVLLASAGGTLDVHRLPAYSAFAWLQAA